MRIILSKHVLFEKIPLIKSLGWPITKQKIRQTIRCPKWEGKTDSGQSTAMSLVDDRYILRAVFKEENGIIKVITVHIARRGRYESTTEN